MSILGYSSSYFLPEYWANTPLYGEKLIPVIDYILSMDYENAGSLAQAFYNIENKYKNQSDLPIEIVEEIIDENGYSYVKDLLGNNETSIRLLLYLMVLIHQLKGTELGIKAVLNFLRQDNTNITFKAVGNPVIVTGTQVISGFSVNDYVVLEGFSATGSRIDIDLKIGGFTLGTEQCIFSSPNYGIYVGIDEAGYLILSLGSSGISWNIVNALRSAEKLSVGTEYYLRLQYDGYEYTLQVSTDKKNYSAWITEESPIKLNIENGALYLGVDISTGVVQLPFSGFINYSDFSVGTDNIEITQWFEQTPVGDENTFIIKTDLDITLVGTDFFEKFSKFIKNYVYPTLKAFTAQLKFRSSLTFIPYVRSKIIYVAKAREYKQFTVKTTQLSEEATDPFITEDDEGYLVY